MRSLAVLAIGLALGAPALATEPSGCDKFKWPIDRERAALTASDRMQVDSGMQISVPPPKAMMLALRPSSEAKLPTEPERAPKDGTFSGFVGFSEAPAAGSFTISLSAAGWVDLVQDGRPLKPVAFSGATDCEGIRKTMKFDLTSKPFVLQISGLKDPSIVVLMTPSP